MRLIETPLSDLAGHGLPPTGKQHRRSRPTKSASVQLARLRSASFHQRYDQRLLIDHHSKTMTTGNTFPQSMVVRGGCLKKGTSTGEKKSVHFDRHSPTSIWPVDEVQRRGDSLSPSRLTRENSISMSTSPIQPFFLSRPSNSRQVSTLIISVPSQFHYYLYPAPKQRSVCHISVNSSSSSSSSDSSLLDFDEETFSSSTLNESPRRRSTSNERTPPPSSSIGNHQFDDKSFRRTAAPVSGLNRDRSRSSVNLRMKAREIYANDFQSKRLFFENRSSPAPGKTSKRASSTDAMIRTTTATFTPIRQQISPRLVKAFEHDLLPEQILKSLESKAAESEIEKVQLHLNELETIVSILVKLNSRLKKIDADLSLITVETKSLQTYLLEQREKILQKHDEANYLKEGIDRRSRVIRQILEKYLSEEEVERYETFLRMQSTEKAIGHLNC